MTVPPPPKRFTGWHITAILVAFFAVVIGVNLFMARQAVSGFGGTVVDNSYVASQNYNRWLAQARAEQALGWTADARLREDGRIVVTARDASGRPFAGQVTAMVRHTVGQGAERSTGFDRSGEGQFLSRDAFPNQRLTVRVALADGSQQMHRQFRLP